MESNLTEHRSGRATIRVGYISVSTLEQNTVRQLDGITVDRVFTDTASGKDTARPQLDELIAFVRAGDTVLVHPWTASPATSTTYAASSGP